MVLQKVIKQIEQSNTVTLTWAQLYSICAEAWDEGWKGAQEVVDLEGTPVFAHTVFPEGCEGNPYR